MTLALFTTPRLRVRRLDAGDVDDLLAVYGDRDSMRWVGDGEPLDRPECLEWVRVTERNYAERGYGMSALVGAASGRVIGFCGLVHPGGQPEPELKYALRREFRGNGYATEAARAMLAYGAEAFGLRRVIATVAPENAASQRVLTKAGMIRLETTRHAPDGSGSMLFAWTPPCA